MSPFCIVVSKTAKKHTSNYVGDDGCLRITVNCLKMCSVFVQPGCVSLTSGR